MPYNPDTTAPTAQAENYPLIWKGMTICRNRDGHDEAFAIGPDDYVWSYLTSTQNGTSGRLVSTGVEARQFVLTTTLTGRRALVAAGRHSLHLTVESDQPDCCWKKSSPILFSGLRNAVAIEELHSLAINGHALVGVMSIHKNVTGLDSYRFWVARWTGEQLQWLSHAVALDGTDPLGNQFIMNRKSSEQTWQ